jgi:hypothetical protein
MSPGIPPSLQILHIEQEAAASETSVLQTILECDIEREDLIKESNAIQAIMDKEEKQQKEQQQQPDHKTNGEATKPEEGKTSSTCSCFLSLLIIVLRQRMSMVFLI